MKTETNTFPPSVLTASQKKIFGPKPFPAFSEKALIRAEVCYDDRCSNGHNTFSITGEIFILGRRDIEAGGCIHEEIAATFPELAPLIKWHGCTSEGPLHYIENTLYNAGERDHWGLKKGEFRQHTSRGGQNNGVAGVPNWVLRFPEGLERDVYATEKPAPVTVEWIAQGILGEGKARELSHARSSAVWPDATDEQLCAEPATLKAALLARLPALMLEFKSAVESLGFVY